MKQFATPMILAGALLASSQASAGDILFWQDNSLSYLNGTDFNQLNFNEEEQKSQSTYTFEHASGWVWGDVFAFYDYVDANNIQYSGSFEQGTFHASENDDFYYMEISPRISLSWLTREDLSIGPLKDVKAAFTYEKGNGGPGTENYLAGIGLDWDVPGFAFFQTNIYRVKINDHVFFTDTSGPGYADQLTVAAAYPFSLGDQDFVIDGYADWRSPSDDAGTQTSLGSSIQAKWDAGKMLFGEGRKLYVGTELNYWHNKYGMIPVDGTNGGFDQAAWQALVKYHF